MSGRLLSELLNPNQLHSVRPLAPRSPLTDGRRSHLQVSCERSRRSALRDRELYEPLDLLLGSKAVFSSERVFWRLNITRTR